jgi:hypothetical protein
METLQDTAFHALAEVYTRVVVSTVTVKPHGLVNMVFIQLEMSQPKAKSASVMQRVLGAYPEEAAVTIKRATIKDSVLTHLRSMTGAKEGKTADMQGFDEMQLAREWRMRHGAMINVKNAIAKRGIDQIDASVEMILKCKDHHFFLEKFGGNKYYVAKEYEKIIKEEARKVKAQAAALTRSSNKRKEIESESESSGDEEDSMTNNSKKRKVSESNSASLDSIETTSSIVSVPSEIANFDLSRFPDQILDDLFGED